MSGRAVPRKKPTPSSISRSPASIARPRPANSSTPPSRPRPTAWSPPRPWRPSCCANGAASPARPQIPGDLFDRLGLRRIRAARLGQQPDGLRLELRRVSRSFCHGSIISHRVRGNAEQKSVHITSVTDWIENAVPAASYPVSSPYQAKALPIKAKCCLDFDFPSIVKSFSSHVPCTKKGPNGSHAFQSFYDSTFSPRCCSRQSN